MFNRKAVIATAMLAFGGLVSTQASAVAVDLSGWTAQGGSSSWNVQAGNDTVLQTVNGAPTVFFDSSVTSTQGTALSGNIKVTTTGDDDFIGFVLGYQNNEIFSSSADFYLVDWKQGDQAGWGKGLGISHVTNGSNGNSSSTGGSFWQHTAGQVDLITRATNLGNTGWADLVEYSFNIIFTSNLIEVAVDGVTELSITPSDVAGVSSFSDGAFGFYNYSQSNVLYSAITQVDCQLHPDALECQGGGGSVPEPGIMALLGLGFAALSFGGYRRRRLEA